MRETLYIRLRQPSGDAPTPYTVVVTDGLGGAPASVFVREAPLSEVIAQAAGRKLVVFVPGAEVRLTQVKVPARQPAKVLQAAPFVLEDQFADDVETLHFSLGPRQPDGAFPVAVASHEHMQEWLAPFRERDTMPDALVPETLALPWENGGPWTVLPEPDHLTARTGAYSGFSCVPEDFELFLQLAENGAPHSLRVLTSSRGEQVDYTPLKRPLELLPGFSHPLEAMVRNLRLAQAINLLQGSYSQRESLDRFWRPWRFAAGLLAAAFVLGIVVNTVEALHFKHAAAAQQSANELRFNQLFPGQRVAAVSLGTQVEQQAQILGHGNGQGGPLSLLQQAADSLVATPGLTLNNAEYREGALFLDLSGTDLQVLEKLRGWYANHRCAVLDVQSADSGEAGAKIRLKLSAGHCS
ncbi:MAG: gspL [Nevskia sp.]|nr:gspL [Nevskia sp.]